MSVPSKVLPVPENIENLDINSLVDFKSRHADAASRLRQQIEEEAINLSTINDPNLRKEQANNVANRLTDTIGELEGAMRSRWQSVTFASILPVLPPLAALAAGGPTAALAVGGVTLATTIYQALSAERTYRATQRQPLAYAVLFKRSSFL